MLKKILRKIILFSLILYSGQLIIFHFFPHKAPIDVQIYKNNHVNVIYFGDSTLFYTSEKDTDKRSTPEILNSLLGKKYNIAMLSSASWPPTIYAAYAEYLKQQKFLPKYVIVPINLRSFSVEWDLRPTFQFEDDINYFRYYNTPLYPFITYISDLSHADTDQTYGKLYMNTMVYNGNIPLGKAMIFQDMTTATPYNTRFKNELAYFYLTPIKPDHRQLLSLLKISDIYKGTGTKVIFYVTPIDYETGEKYYGKDFKDIISQNVRTITSGLHKNGAQVIDLSFGLPSKDFTWPEAQGFYRYPNEHVNYEGKYYISTHLAKVISPAKPN